MLNGAVNSPNWCIFGIGASLHRRPKRTRTPSDAIRADSSIPTRFTGMNPYAGSSASVCSSAKRLLQQSRCGLGQYILAKTGIHGTEIRTHHLVEGLVFHDFPLFDDAGASTVIFSFPTGYDSRHSDNRHAQIIVFLA